MNYRSAGMLPATLAQGLLRFSFLLAIRQAGMPALPPQVSGHYVVSRL